jgi:histidine phosphotransferase ChpT
MADLGETMRLVELTSARLCHDLGGLIGTVGNALEMMTEDEGGDNEVHAFASSAAKALAQRLRLMRAAWGPESETMTITALRALIVPALGARRIGLDMRTLPAGSVFTPPVARVVLNLIMLAGDCLPRGGTVVLMGTPGDLLVRIDGPGAAWPTGLVPCLGDETAALTALAGVASVQMPLTVLLALSRGLRLSPVLGPAGVEALRLDGG